ncbi:MAG: hypothetical protein ACOCQR_00005 [bacterium]
MRYINVGKTREERINNTDKRFKEQGVKGLLGVNIPLKELQQILIKNNFKGKELYSKKEDLLVEVEPMFNRYELAIYDYDDKKESKQAPCSALRRCG